MILQIESTVMPYLQVLSEFREGVRQIAREKKGESSLFPVLLHVRLVGHRNQTEGEDGGETADRVSPCLENKSKASLNLNFWISAASLFNLGIFYRLLN